jgi:hypothetical protein
LVLESRLFTFEDGLWNVRGRFEKAYDEDEELVWSDVGGEHIAHILIVSSSCLFFICGNYFGLRTLLEMAWLLHPLLFQLLLILYLSQSFLLLSLQTLHLHLVFMT